MRDIKKVGEYVATVHLHKEVTVEIPVAVVAENAPKAEAPVAKEAPKAEAPVEAAEEETSAEA